MSRKNGNYSDKTIWKSSTKDEKRFHEAKKKIDESVKKHLKKMESSSGSSDEEPDTDGKEILDKLFQNYELMGGTDLGRTKQYIENSFYSGNGVCLICIATIKKYDAIWNCHNCFGSFHIICIQKWAKDSIFHLKRALEELPTFKRSSVIAWACPKCRQEYDEKVMPQTYYCFCGNTTDPQPHPWLMPHSCGESCNKELQPKCGHRCLLLCHPGPCPPCPKSVNTPCYCGHSAPQTRRCSDKNWSCGKQCRKLLFCSKHQCEALCHPGECSSCPRQSLQFCQCGDQQTMRPCSEPFWQCDKVCGKKYSCGNHICQLTCHKGACGECPLSKERKCPCGKSTSVLPCTQETLTCNDTCGKLMDCGKHYCAHKCHKDKCACLEIVRKSCRCGQHQKELPCGKEFLCETKCKMKKACGKHQCNRRCCDGTCPPCEKPCGRVLGCGNHRCESVCHSRPCYPCPLMCVIKCRCGLTQISVPCGKKRKTKPPRCLKLCQISPDCDHEKRNSHRCHFGECPPCKQICKKPRPNCQHFCPSACHIQVWRQIEDNYIPKGPWEVTSPQLKRCNLPCPPCIEPVAVTCAGSHVTEYFPCHQAQPVFSCGRPCGQPLPCGNHFCQLECHSLSKTCEECTEDCGKSRPAGCNHQCPWQCHQGDCPPCNQKSKVKCHCGLVTLYVACTDLTSADVERKNKVLCCGGDCPKNYQCGHRCRSACHPGSCPNLEGCRKKVKQFCPCGRFKKDVPCDVVQKKEIQVACNDICLAKQQELIKEKEVEALKIKEEEERRNKEELEKFEKKLMGKKKVRERKRYQEEDEKHFQTYYILVSIALIFGILGGIYAVMT